MKFLLFLIIFQISLYVAVAIDSAKNDFQAVFFENINYGGIKLFIHPGFSINIFYNITYL